MLIEQSAIDPSRIESSANRWERFHHEFKALMEEEDRIVQEQGPKDCCYAYFTDPESGEFGCWIENAATESLDAQFKSLATKAGIALGLPPGTSPLRWWLYQLVHDLRANQSNLLRSYGHRAGFIERLIEASATYCIRLDQQSHEKAVLSGEGAPLQRGLNEPCRGGDPDSAQRERPGGTMPMEDALSIAQQRIRKVDDFIRRCNRECVGFRVFRKHIWFAAGHARARQFQYWQAGSTKASGLDAQAFGRILDMRPAEFIALVKRKVSPS
jgi:hypothetical protein